MYKSLRHQDLGFTIIELIVVIMILGVIGTLAVLAWPNTTVFNLHAQVELIVSEIRYAQNLSMTHGVRYAFYRDSSNTYRIATITGANAVTKTLGDNIQFGNFNNLPNNLIAFDGRGVPYVDTALPGTPLTSRARIRLTAGGETVSIRIRPDSGQVYIQ